MEKAKKGITIVIICLLIGFVICMIIAGGKRKSKMAEYKKTDFTMGTVLNITIYGGSQTCTDDIKGLLDRLENEEISWRAENSAVWKLNHEYRAGEAYKVSYELGNYINKVKELYINGEKLLDATIRPLAALWGIEDGKNVVPDKQNIKEAQKKVDMDRVDIAASEDGAFDIIIKEADMSIDLGAVGKGIGCDKVYEYLKESDITGACISIGGSIVVYGDKPDKSSYKLGIRSPRGETGDIMGVIELNTEGKALFMSTSGDYEKYFEKDGKRYHHILNPLTGYPADTGMISATIVCDNGLVSDGLSTLAMLLGKEKAVSLIERYHAEAVLIDKDMNVYVTEGLKASFTLKCDDYKVEE